MNLKQNQWLLNLRSEFATSKRGESGRTNSLRMLFATLEKTRGGQKVSSDVLVAAEAELNSFTLTRKTRLINDFRR
jgi:hypothetical protein